MPAAKKVAGPAHPPYEKMVKAALVALKDRTGSSTQAIAKYLKANYDLPENFAKSLSRFLKKFVESGKLVKVKASYKLGSLKTEPKPKKKKVVKKKAPKKKVAKKKAPKKTTAPKKKVAKKPKKPKKKVVKKKK
eukprot:CAMPEP_0197475492 /NCGR_PEP_ID=MMETSP1309-20131121/6936_1 /TAXON_ID=464262 /ORGANISM="Genus nov. species nov., Strain RCC998" /LENGTH=133 /DNA_ID=CAMNT_0043015537 /DNA_START=213 /DNA_END=614 /DNA_ORIENTATION=+